EDPWGETFDGNEKFAMSCDNSFAFAACDCTENVADGLVCGHNQPSGMGSLADSWSVPLLSMRRMLLATKPGLMSVTLTPERASSGVMALARARTANLLM